MTSMENHNSSLTDTGTDIGAGSWKKIMNKNGIIVHKRSVLNSKFLEFKGETEIKSSLSSFAALMLDAENMSSWMHKTKEVRVLEQISDNERIAYMRFDFSPLPGRDLVVKNAVSQNPDTLTVTYSMEFLETHHALDKSDFGHMKGLRGVATATPLQDGSIRFSYQTHIEPGSELLLLPLAPTITNKLLSDTPFYTLKNARKLIAESRYQNAKFDFIKNIGD